MTKIPSVEETLDEVDKYWDTDRTEATRAIMKYASGQRIALLTELRDSGLLEEKAETSQIHTADFRGMSSTAIGLEQNKGSNTLARAIKAHLDNLIKSNSV